MQKRYLFFRSLLAFFLIFLFISFTFVWNGHSLASSIKKPILKNQDLVPSSIITWPSSGSEFTVLVDKSSQQVLVYRKGHLNSPEKVYDCSTGENGGPKTRKNDRKTPEGIYFFTGSFEDRDLAPIYGIRAFPINYPNPVDKKEGKGGYGIWFHGTNKPLKPRDSNGCIAMENESIDDLAKYVELFKTPVIISSNIKMVEPWKRDAEAEEISDLIEAWRSSWESKDINRYVSIYHKKFTSGSKNINKWREYKQRLAKQYKMINVGIDDLQILRNDGLLMARFRQDYSADNFVSQGRKTLYLQKNSNEWKIIGEFFDKEKEKTLIAKKTQAPSDRTLIKRLVYQWRDAWEDKQIGKYIASYDRTFKSRGMNVSAWKKHRQRLNRKYNSLSINIRDLKIVVKPSGHATVTFIQDYKADHYRDKGIKELRLIKKGKSWKIQKEEWKPLKG